MKNHETALQGFLDKASCIINKYSAPHQPLNEKYGLLRLAGFFSDFNATLADINEELHNEGSGILKHYINNEHVDFTGLVDSIYEQKMEAKLAFIKTQQPPGLAL